MADKKFLVIDDDPLVRSSAVVLLEAAGLEVVQMDSADEALAFVYDHPGDIAAIFSDISMPGHLSGLHLAETVARHWPSIAVLLSSGLVRPAGDLPPSVRFLAKPWMPHDLLTAVRSMGADASAAGSN